jgi:hypothetical protein
MKNINDRIDNLDSIVKDLLKGEDFNLSQYIKSSKHHVGVSHSLFEKDNGYLASCHCVFEDFEAFNETHIKCIWKAGFIVSNEIFEKVNSQEYNGFSFGAKGHRIALNEVEE